MTNIYQELCKYELPAEVPAGHAICQLTGDASSRSYYRITTPRGSIVLMKMPEPFDENNFPYLENYHLFRSADIPLAEIFHTEPSKGLVFLQDLGDMTFYELYDTWKQQHRLYYFTKSLDLMAAIQQIKPRSDLAFTTERLLWELNYFLEYFLTGFRGAKLASGELDELQAFFRQLASELSERSRFFCHRDYHSRNLMVQGEKLYVIDFQDARFGPATYDLASLCYDSYLQHSPEVIRQLERLFFIRHPSAETEQYEYPRMKLQRNLKALGTFGYQASVLDRSFYIQFIDPTLGYVRKHLRELPEYSEFGKLLARHLPELG